jgi:hypothetical protein
MSALPDLRLETHFSRWEFTARYHMAASDAQSMMLRDLLAMASPEDAEAFDRLWLGYTQTFGDPGLRADIAGTYDNLEAADILCFAGAEEGIYIANKVLLGPKDHAIVVTPNYQAADLYERALSLNVMSKAYGLPGLRIGWIGCRDRELLVRMARVSGDSTLAQTQGFGKKKIRMAARVILNYRLLLVSQPFIEGGRLETVSCQEHAPDTQRGRTLLGSTEEGGANAAPT